nr:Crossover junction endodeoxyribonuclease rusA [Klebsiella pneumoniae]
MRSMRKSAHWRNGPNAGYLDERGLIKHEPISHFITTPPSNNRYYRHNRGRTHISAEGQAYRDSVARIIKDSMLDIGPPHH